MSDTTLKKLHQRNTSTIEIGREHLNRIKEIAHKKNVKVRDILNSILDIYFNIKNNENIDNNGTTNNKE